MEYRERERETERDTERDRERVWFGLNFLYVINVIVLTIGHHFFWIFID